MKKILMVLMALICSALYAVSMEQERVYSMTFEQGDVKLSCNSAFTKDIINNTVSGKIKIQYKFSYNPVTLSFSESDLITFRQCIKTLVDKLPSKPLHNSIVRIKSGSEFVYIDKDEIEINSVRMSYEDLKTFYDCLEQVISFYNESKKDFNSMTLN